MILEANILRLHNLIGTSLELLLLDYADEFNQHLKSSQVHRVPLPGPSHFLPVPNPGIFLQLLYPGLFLPLPNPGISLPISLTLTPR